MKIRQLTIEEAEFIAHRLATELMYQDDEPIPPFSTRSPGKLESCLAEPFQTFDGKSLHYRFVDKAATLFYLITKDHCFGNGNKRMAVTLTTVFFYVNKRWLNVQPRALYEIACQVAESSPNEREVYTEALTKFFLKNTTEMPHKTTKKTI